ncbi:MULTISPECIES: DEAD/DEAH box helicase [unclassified Nocardia]|uniref:DEAD/DEAH box helicase n=1 Tax=unclassified Nocardia TaxID=2637762 RepID=UPI001CE3EEF6|nr:MULTISPECIES: DEAD/DEAH box helicase [unclassified Nocardia]
MASVHEVIEVLRQIPNNAERGIKFEELMVRYFQHDPLLTQQYDQVWRWKDWPGRGGKPDTGIDLVARERDSDEYTAIQCKFYDPAHQLAKEDIDSFFTASGKKPFTNRLIISTTDRWSKHAEDALEGQLIPVERLGLADIADSPIDWDIAWPGGEVLFSLAPATRNEPRPHQITAIEKVFENFAAGHDRGKLIMACGTGKTFTALQIAERTVHENGGAARVLFCVPSISLLSQTLREWTAQTRLDLRAFAVCSDTKVSRAAEDFRVHDVAIPVTTDATKLAQEMAHRKRAKGLTVVFTTYQSLPVVAEAQRDHGVDAFDLAICDEAHRTTGVTAAGADESNFVRIHDADYLKSTRRLYMTATPRIYDERAKDQADEHGAEIASMDDETVFGPEFHRLSFGEAVDRNLLTDYKVLVLTVDEDLIASPMQQQLAGEHSELQLDDASKIVGCWNGLAKRAGQTPDGGLGFAIGEPPMRRAVAFAADIADSKGVAKVFPAVVDAYRDLLENNDAADRTNIDLHCEVEHVDGTFNALERNRKLSWLKAPIPEGECRILTNARCLSEGVDVPALDAVMFLHPRNSVVDVVQSVGRVMRRSEGKDYGYIILPVAVPSGISPAQALSDNRRFRVVWQVLNALRAHDDRFNAMVNSINLNTGDPSTGKGTDRLLGAHIGPTTDTDERIDTGNPATDAADAQAADAQTGTAIAQQMALFSLSDWQEAIFARIVDKVGTRVYWEEWAADVADIAATLIIRINSVLKDAEPAVTDAFDAYLQGLRDNLNDSITRDDGISMLAQHLITKPVFDALFADHDFATHNPVSRVMQSMVDTLGGAGLEAETAQLQGFYDSVRMRAAEITTAEGKQQIIAELYEKFFRIGFKKQADALGIVYTPWQVIDFILTATDTALRDAFGRGLTHENVHILDPFTGTGTFITRLLQSGLILPTDLARKYTSELHANELMLLAYYIAAVNIETTYHALTGKTENTHDYEPFPGIILADTFQISEHGDSLDALMFPQNNARIIRLLETPINVILGNPPYSVGQTSANDLNANIKYPTLDSRIENTYAKYSTATLKNSLYDSYIRAFRWASDRIGDTGIVAFVSNGGWIDGNTADGIRHSLAAEYSRIYVYNLRGNQRTAGELSRKEGGKIFGSGSRNTVAIFIGIKNPAHTGPCDIHYRDIGDYLSRDDKLQILADTPLNEVDWQTITPNQHDDWINQRSGEFTTWAPLGEKGKAAKVAPVFAAYSGGIKSNRDAWVYNFSSAEVGHNARRMIDFYNNQVDEFDSRYRELSTADRKRMVNGFIDANAAEISWTSGTHADLIQGKKYIYDGNAIVIAHYRPFNASHVYFDRQLIERPGRLPLMFPTQHHKNIGFMVMAPREGTEFAALATDIMPDLSFFTYTGQFFPRWTYSKPESAEGELDFDSLDAGDIDEYGYRKIDNITDDTLFLYRAAVGGQVSKDDIFYYVYGLLHDPAYRETYAADLKKMLPRIPTPASPERFELLATAGRRLADLHVNYETIEPYPLDVQLKSGTDVDDRETWRVQKLKWKSKADRTTIVYNSKVTITGIPEDAQRYMLGSRSALDWIINRYQVDTDKASGIVNDPNDWSDEHSNPTYIVDLIKRITTVSLETLKIVDELSESE